MITLHPQYITDSSGKKLSAILPMHEFSIIMEQLDELEDLRLYDEGKSDNEPALPKDQAMIMLQAERKKLGK